MAEGKDKATSLSGTRRLADAVRAAKIAAAHRSDVVVDIREADRARLEILSDVMQPVVNDVPANDDFFDFTISGGPQPRFWIDGTAHVSMARDRRTYRFTRETRLGRVTLAEATDVHHIADRVTVYVAERIVEREKAFADADVPRVPQFVSDKESAKLDPIGAFRSLAAQPNFAFALSWLLIGMVIGAGILLAVAALRGFQLR